MTKTNDDVIYIIAATKAMKWQAKSDDQWGRVMGFRLIGVLFIRIVSDLFLKY